MTRGPDIPALLDEMGENGIEEVEEIIQSIIKDDEIFEINEYPNKSGKPENLITPAEEILLKRLQINDIKKPTKVVEKFKMPHSKLQREQIYVEILAALTTHTQAMFLRNFRSKNNNLNLRILVHSNKHILIIIIIIIETTIIDFIRDNNMNSTRNRKSKRNSNSNSKRKNSNVL